VKKAPKKVVVTKHGKEKTLLVVPKPKRVGKKETCDEDDVLKSSQSSVKSEDVSWDILELSQESRSSQSSNSRFVIPSDI
jgi:hypothetical protein